jgi:hypothetical protein
MTISPRKSELIKRAGKDPVQLDTRSLSEIMGDEIPYLRWAKEMQVLIRTGHKTWVELLKERFDARKKDQR